MITTTMIMAPTVMTITITPPTTTATATATAIRTAMVTTIITSQPIWEPPLRSASR